MKLYFETNFFQKYQFSQKDVLRYYRNAVKTFQLGQKYKKEPEIVFVFAYRALLKLSITLIAFHGYRTKSRAGHHIKILEKASQILNDETVFVLGDKMRKKRHSDLYGSGVLVSQKEAVEYLKFVERAFKQTAEYIRSQKSLFQAF